MSQTTPGPTADEHWDFYEITFSIDGDNIDAALKVYAGVEAMPGVKGACFSGGDHSDGHPFTKADVTRAAAAIEQEIEGRSGGDAWLYGIDEDTRAEMLDALAKAALTAATNPDAPS